MRMDCYLSLTPLKGILTKSRPDGGIRILSDTVPSYAKLCHLMPNSTTIVEFGN